MVKPFPLPVLEMVFSSVPSAGLKRLSDLLPASASHNARSPLSYANATGVSIHVSGGLANSRNGFEPAGFQNSMAGQTELKVSPSTSDV